MGAVVGYNLFCTSSVSNAWTIEKPGTATVLQAVGKEATNAGAPALEPLLKTTTEGAKVVLKVGVPADMAARLAHGAVPIAVNVFTYGKANTKGKRLRCQFGSWVNTSEQENQSTPAWGQYLGSISGAVTAAEIEAAELTVEHLTTVAMSLYEVYVAMSIELPDPSGMMM